jgi:hypothetical protein
MSKEATVVNMIYLTDGKALVKVGDAIFTTNRFSVHGWIQITSFSAVKRSTKRMFHWTKSGTG